MKKIAIFQNDLGIGGIQKSLINFLNNIDLNQIEVDLFLFSHEDFFKADLPKEVRIHHLKPLPSWMNFIPFEILSRFKPIKIDGQYDLAIDYNGYRYDCSLAALSVNAQQYVLWIHSDYLKKRENEPKYRILYQFAKAKYRHFDVFVGVSQAVIDTFVTMTQLRQPKMILIPNFIDTQEIFSKSTAPIDFKPKEEVINFVSMARLTYAKGFDLLFQDFRKVVDQTSAVHLYVIGDGPDKIKLKELVNALSLQDHVTFMGQISNPFPYLKQMDAFILASRYEGQGMVLFEAKSLGLPLIIPAHLERYVPGIKGTGDLVKAMLDIKKKTKEFDALMSYNRDVLSKTEILFALTRNDKN